MMLKLGLQVWRVVAIVFIVLLFTSAASAVEFVQLSASQARELIDMRRGDTNFVILDVRTPKEYAQGHIGGAQLLDYYSPGYKVGLQRLDRDKTYFIYCRSGNRSGRTLKMIAKMGFGKVYHLTRGIVDWNKSKLPLVKPSS